CSVCKKIFNQTNPCECQQEEAIKALKVGTPINIVGTKLKGKIYKIKNDTLEVLIIHEKNRYLKEYSLSQVRKVL
ncbi:MAG: hypothetical protein ACRC1P_09085, partial [Cellulosilyticaceae bacterium]